MPTSISSPFGSLLRQHRLAATLTQEALAERAGLSTDGVQKLERGVTHPFRDTIQRLVTALQLAGPDERAFREAAPAPRQRRPLPPPQPNRPRHNLPIPLTSFLGRERDVAAVRRLLDQARLVTLVGPGGIGKTRLAVEVAAELVGGYADGVWLVELAALTDPELVPSAIAAAVGVREQPQEPVLATLVATMRQQQTLLLLDNCEHLIGACASVADALLQAGGGVRVLATSREPLRVAGETVWRLAPLAVPADDTAPQALRNTAAVRLFLDRAAAADPTFTLADTDVPAVTRLCRRLDGLPLAIELVAPLIRLLSLHELARRLDDRFRLPAGGRRTAPKRQQTLHAALDWSYDLLDAPARTLFQQLSVFAGGWTLDAVEVVCSGEGIDRDAVLPLLLRLVDQSLVVVEEATGGARRYHLLETVRAYAGERLQASRTDGTIRARHAAQYLALADMGEAAILETDLCARRTWLDLPEAEHDNLRAAWSWLVDRREVGQGLLHVGALGKYAYQRGHLAEGKAFLRTLLAINDPVNPSPALVTVLWSAAMLAQFHGGDYAAAQALAERCLDAQRRLSDRAGAAATLSLLAVTRREQGDQMAAHALLVESLAINREVGNRIGIAVALDRLGAVAHALGDFAAAHALYEQGGQLAREIDHPKLLPWSPHNLGCLALDQGDYATARSLLGKSLALWRNHADTLGIVYSLLAFASLAAAEGRPERALVLAGAATGIADALGARLVPTYRRGFERRMALAREGLSEAVATTAWSAGRAITLEQAVAAALEADGGTNGDDEPTERAAAISPS